MPWCGGCSTRTTSVDGVAAPEFVPVDRTKLLRTYESPPRRPAPWLATRPAELPGGQPQGPTLGYPGPDQGFVLRLARQFHGKLALTTGEHERDALAGGCAVALRRASLFGRAPVVHDLTVALTVWGFLGEAAPDLVQMRKPLFEEVAHPHHYFELRRLVDLVAEDTLRMTPQQVAQAHRADWRSLLVE
jgi:hypothetical protein